MKISYLVVFATWVLYIRVECQIGAPGGIRKPLQWFTAAPDGKPFFTNVSDSSQLLLPQNPQAMRTGMLNFHPAVLFGENSKFSINLGKYNSSITLFTVYSPVDTLHENAIWYMSRHNKASLILTTARSADFERKTYMNFIDIHRGESKLSIYTHHKENLIVATSDLLWEIGDKPPLPSLPIKNFHGMIPEFIAYDRVLNAKERIQVASYLSIKYGLTLTEPGGKYYNSQGEPVWEGLLYPVYHHNIAGIARDDSSGLLQTRANSSNQKGLFTFSTKALPSNFCFLLWGDNALPLAEGERTEGQPIFLQKKWLTIANLSTAVNAGIQIDTRQLDIRRTEQSIYWLAIDHSGTGTFDPANTDLLKMNQINENGVAAFEGIKFEKGKNQKALIALSTGPDLMMLARLKPASCILANEHAFSLKLFGGKPPFRLVVSSNNFQRSYDELNGNSFPLTVSHLSAGKYVLTVRDEANQNYTDSFYLNPLDAPVPSTVKANYQLEKGKQIVIDASGNMQSGVQYTWSGPGGYIASGPKAIISQKGNYTLTTSRNGCGSTKEINISLSANSIYTDITVYPNPSTGRFTTHVSLANSAKVSLAVYAADGRQILKDEKSGMANYIFSYRLTANGVYLLVFESNGNKEVRKLVIAK